MKLITFTAHAEAMLGERSIAREWVVETLNNPDAIEPDPNAPGIFRAFRSIPENGGRVLRVVYRAQGDGARVVTAFFDRNRSR